MFVIFDHGKFLEIEPLSDKFSQKWYKEVSKIHKNGIRENKRIYGFNNEWSYEKCLNKILDIVNTVNNYKQFIDYDIRELDQQKLNDLHVYFENMIGVDSTNTKLQRPGDFFESAPKNIKDAIIEFNVLIHRIESMDPDSFWSKRIVVTFKDRPRHKIPESELYRFNFKIEPGDVCLNYCHVGKPLYDVYSNDDHSITEENIFPQSHWSSDFHIMFKRGLGFKNSYHEKVSAWWKKNKVELNSLGFYENDTKNAWGLFKVAKVVNYDPNYLEGITKIEKIEF